MKTRFSSAYHRRRDDLDHLADVQREAHPDELRNRPHLRLPAARHRDEDIRQHRLRLGVVRARQQRRDRMRRKSSGRQTLLPLQRPRVQRNPRSGTSVISVVSSWFFRMWSGLSLKRPTNANNFVGLRMSVDGASFMSSRGESEWEQGISSMLSVAIAGKEPALDRPRGRVNNVDTLEDVEMSTLLSRLP